MRSFAAERKEVSRYHAAVHASYLEGALRSKAYGAFTGMISTTGMYAVILVLWYGGTLVIRGELSPGELTSFLLYAARSRLTYDLGEVHLRRRALFSIGTRSSSPWPLAVCNHPYLFQGAEITIYLVARRLLLMTAGTFHRALRPVLLSEQRARRLDANFRAARQVHLEIAVYIASRRVSLTTAGTFSDRCTAIPNEGGATPRDFRGVITLCDVSFAYPSRPSAPVLDAISLEIQPATVVALCGPSGSGKSSIIALIERFYDPTSGAVLLDGKPLISLDASWWRRQARDRGLPIISARFTYHLGGFDK